MLKVVLKKNARGLLETVYVHEKKTTPEICFEMFSLGRMESNARNVLCSLCLVLPKVRLRVSQAPSSLSPEALPPNQFLFTRKVGQLLPWQTNRQAGR